MKSAKPVQDADHPRSGPNEMSLANRATEAPSGLTDQADQREIGIMVDVVARVRHVGRKEQMVEDQAQLLVDVCHFGADFEARWKLIDVWRRSWKGIPGEGQVSWVLQVPI